MLALTFVLLLSSVKAVKNSSAKYDNSFIIKPESLETEEIINHPPDQYTV